MVAPVPLTYNQEIRNRQIRPTWRTQDASTCSLALLLAATGVAWAAKIYSMSSIQTAARVCDVVEVAIIHPYDHLARFGDYKYDSKFFETILLYFRLSTFGEIRIKSAIMEKILIQFSKSGDYFS